MHVIVSTPAQKQLNSLPAEVKSKVLAKYAELGSFPAVSGIKALKGALKGKYRARVGNYRILFRVVDGNLEVLSVDDRKDVYDRDPELATEHRSSHAHGRRKHLETNHAYRLGLVALGRDLYVARKIGGFSQLALARKIHRSQAAVSGSEAGTFLVSPTYVAAVLNVCGLPRNWKSET